MAYRNRSKEQSQEGNLKYYNKTKNAPNRYNRYSEQELLLIWQHNVIDTELSKILGRITFNCP